MERPDSWGEPVDPADLSSRERKALSAAEEAREHAYAPFSDFYVGASLMPRKGSDVISGTNFESGSMALGLCAERTALARANAMGVRDFSLLAISARSKNFNTEKATPPCGGCRQVIAEFAQLAQGPFKILLSATRRNILMRTTSEQLLPGGFGPRDMNVDLTQWRAAKEVLQPPLESVVDMRKVNDGHVELIRSAYEASARAYNPYSGISVGAALRHETNDGITAAANLDNAAFPQTITAVQAATAIANTQGHRNFRGLAVYMDERILPHFRAGMEILREVNQESGRDLPIFVASTRGVIQTTFSKLIPDA